MREAAKKSGREEASHVERTTRDIFLRPDHGVHGSERQCVRVVEIDIFRHVSCVGACERGKLSAEKSWRHRPSTNQPGRESFMLYVEK